MKIVLQVESKKDSVNGDVELVLCEALEMIDGQPFARVHDSRMSLLFRKEDPHYEEVSAVLPGELFAVTPYTPEDPA